MVAPHSMFSLEVANDRLDSFTAFESVGILLLIHPQWHAGSSAGACWILAMGNRSFLQGNSPYDRSFLQSIKAKSATLLIKSVDCEFFRAVHAIGAYDAVH